ncbi:AF4/FMR2 family member 1-like [Athene cunicularia]|uniref:AF4/FMR2 family member 1-like n=1 Tax=Athene cunicularia TaxID=194338 RepID=UPI000EF693C5|nr:AF4/FMR2 family member 1-like [Athene cunicularia]
MFKGIIPEDDLQLSDSEEDSDDQVAEKPPSSLAPPREKQMLLLVRDCPGSQQKSAHSPGSHQRRAEDGEVRGVRKQDLERRITDTRDKSCQKRKREVEKEIDWKKKKSDKETKSLQSSAQEDSSKLKQHPVEYYIKEAKRLKHKADTMDDRTGRAFQYLDAALSFIEYGIALESDPTEPKSASSVFSGTIDLLKFIMRLKSFTDSTASSQDKIFAVLCMRCQSLLHMAMFRYKKHIAMKYSRILNDHFRSSSRSTQAPSLCVARSTGMTSYAGSGYSENSIGSSVTVPYNIPNITSAYINISSYILYACDIWEKADALAGKNTWCCCCHSSLPSRLSDGPVV